MIFILLLICLLHYLNAEFVLFEKPPEGCMNSYLISKSRCLQRINSIKGCENWLHWVGRGCPNGRDGGCQFRGHCHFSCKRACLKQKECFWVGNKRNGYCKKKFSVITQILQEEYSISFVKKTIRQSIERWRKIIAGQTGWGISKSTNVCGRDYSIPSGIRIEDLLILFDFRNMDGEGGILASAAPCIDWNDGTTAVGVIRVDKADMATTFAISPLAFLDTITHEIGHVLGIGNKWPLRKLLAFNDTDIFYKGVNGNRGYKQIQGQGALQTYFDQRHWNPSEVGLELMNPFIDINGGAKLSALSGRSLADLSYVIRNDAKSKDSQIPNERTVPVRGFSLQ